MAWQSYNLDRKAQKLVLQYRDKEVLNQSHKMRLAVPYGLERFWGEHLRLISKPETLHEGEFWKATWNTLVDIMSKAGVKVPNELVNPKKTSEIEIMAEKLWDEQEFPREDRQFTLAVLTQLCDSLVWWTQRYKKKSERDEEVGEDES